MRKYSESLSEVIKAAAITQPKYALKCLLPILKDKLLVRKDISVDKFKEKPLYFLLEGHQIIETFKKYEFTKSNKETVLWYL